MAKKPARSPKRLFVQSLEKRDLLAADLGLASDSIEQDILASAVERAAEQIAAIYSVDGTGNNLVNPDWGATETELLRLTTVEYSDGLSEPAGEDRPSAREISNTVADQVTTEANDRYLTDFVWLWGQFIDHDIDLSESADPAEAFDIEVPIDDPDFVGVETIGLNRTVYEVDDEGVRQQLNEITAYIDGSQIYGSDQVTADSLREFEGGRLRTSEGDLLPVGEDGFFEAGDIRANENVALTSMHTLWVREHNRLADEIAAADPSLSDEEIYQTARAIVIAELQSITYNEWLPALLGVDAISDYEGYDPEVNASIANVFSTAAFRFGHTMLSTELLRLDNSGEVSDEGNLSLSNAFFSPQELLDNGIDSLLLGAASQLAQEVDSQVVDDVRNFLFGNPGAGGFDLASLNIQRGRDHGLADYNQVRVDYGLEPVTSFSQITANAELAGKLEALYGSVDNIDAWVGVLAEDHQPGSSLGELGRAVIVDQFERIRDGDRLWYQNNLSGETLAMVENTTLADVLVRNTEITDLLDNVFYGEAVFYFAEEYGRGAIHATLTVRNDQLQLVEDRTGRVLQSQAVDSVEKVIIIGSQGSDSIRLTPEVSSLALAGGIVIDGQGSGRDSVLVEGTRSVDTIAVDTVSVDEAFVDLNGIEVQLADVEALFLANSPGRDSISIDDDGGMRVVVENLPTTPVRPNRQHTPQQRPDRQDPSRTNVALDQLQRDRARDQQPADQLARERAFERGSLATDNLASRNTPRRR